ncbi:MAG TPA: decaprenyl-phosphate phosphoribosyltransferase [Thermoleophilaceae bacterium]|nr:decaprenyl-phosphate phosphoribosyltransferase [Thermoleophilaceae bacterium]
MAERPQRAGSKAAPEQAAQHPHLEPVEEQRRDAARAPARVAPSRPEREPLPRALLRAARPRQWTKNVLVLAAPGAAGVLTQAPSLARTAVAFAAFSLAASGTYLLNDVRDVEADRAHPRKRRRPVASGAVSEPLAVSVGVLLVAAGLGLAAAVNLMLVGLLVLYVALGASYTLWLKHVAIMDIAIVASGFVIRAVAGGVAVGVPISRWFLIVASFGSLFMVAGKRHGEHLDLGDARAKVRATLSEYSRDYLRYVLTTASAVTITAYCLWAFEQSGQHSGAVLFELSIVPFVLFMLRYALLLGHGRGSAPEDLVLGDRGLQLAAAAWVLVYGAGVYLA